MVERCIDIADTKVQFFLELHMTTQLQKRHRDALRGAYEYAKHEGADLTARYLRETMRILDVSLTEDKPVKRVVKKTLSEINTGAWMRPLKPSEPLAAVVGKSPLPRVEIVSKLWYYIKKNKLQDDVNKRMINCDETLKAIFGKDEVSMFEMAGLIGTHVS